MTTQKKYIALLLLSLIGFVLFFPIPFGENDCCLGDMWTVFGKTFHHAHGHHHETAHHSGLHHEGADRAHRYFFPFGVLWWSSLALGWLSIRRLTIKNQKGQDEDIAQHSPVV